MPTFTAVPLSNRSVLIWRLREPELQGSPVWQFPGEIIPYEITVEGANAPSSPVVAVYKGRTDVTSTVMPTNTPTASGQVISTSALKLLTANSDYAVMITATIGGKTEQRKLVVRCADDKAV